MAGFHRARGRISVHLDEHEQRVLAQVVQEFVELLEAEEHRHAAPPQPEEQHDDDPFAVWEASFGVEKEEPDPGHGTDPVQRRLFPDAYRDDPEAAADFRRYTQPEQRRQKVLDAIVVLDDLDQVRAGASRIAPDRVDGWLRTLNNLRLVISVMLGITDETSHAEAASRSPEDPRSMTYGLYGWLGWMLESLVECVMSPE